MEMASKRPKTKGERQYRRQLGLYIDSIAVYLGRHEKALDIAISCVVAL